ncbi:MAG: metallophosphoesterase [Bacillota bacterium]|nr:metallophosphoesterase [Bacillota bacterium]
MKILIVSDSHGDKETLLSVIEKENPEKVFFLGDYISDIYEIESLLNADICAVKGNTDVGVNGVEDIILNIYNQRILLTHGHKYNVNQTMYKLYLKARENFVDYVFFGHTHRYEDFIENGIRFINPGSIAKPRDGDKGTYIIFDMQVDEVRIIKKVLT